MGVDSIRVRVGVRGLQAKFYFTSCSIKASAKHSLASEAMFTSRLYTSRWGNPQWDKTTLTWLGSDANGEGAWLVLPLASALGETLQFYSNTSPQPLILLACSLISIKGLGLAHEHMMKAQCVI